MIGPLSDYSICALLPNYLEQGDSSLISMVSNFMNHSRNPSGFYLKNTNELVEKIRKNTKPTLLFGVTYALLDIFEKYGSIKTPQLTIIETGGMKGRGKEFIRESYLSMLKKNFSRFMYQIRIWNDRVAQSGVFSIWRIYISKLGKNAC